jgi:ketosteroid isomerase-like protein
MHRQALKQKWTLLIGSVLLAGALASDAVFAKPNTPAPGVGGDVGTLLQRLVALEDREAIRTVIHSYHHTMDKHDEAGYLDLFEEDALLSFGPQYGDSQGRAEIQQNLHQNWAFLPRMHHIVGNTVITQSGDWAEATSDATAHSYTADGISILSFVTYRDILSKRSGKWRFVERVAEIHYSAPWNQVYQP